MRAIPPATGIVGLPATLGCRARPARDVPLGSFAEPSCQKIVFDLQLADLPVQNIGMRLAGRPLRRRAATLENTRRAVQQLLLPVVDLIRVNPELARQLGDRPVTLHRRQRHLRFERRVVLLPCLLHLLLPRHQRFLGAGLHLSQLSRFRGPPQRRRTRSMRGLPNWSALAWTLRRWHNKCWPLFAMTNFTCSRTLKRARLSRNASGRS